MTVRNTRLLVMCGVWPHYAGNLEAANVVSYEILNYLTGAAGWQVAFCLVNVSTPETSAVARKDLQKLQDKGLELLPPVNFSAPTPGRAVRWLAALTADPQAMIPGWEASSSVTDRARIWGADALMTIWSEAATAAASRVGLPLIAYYGNPDHKAFEARAKFEWERRSRSLASAVSYAKALVQVSALRRAHLEVMKRCALIAEVAANDAGYYRESGLTAARYVRNMWHADQMADYREYRRQHEHLQPAKIVASVGNLSATGNTLGFDTLGREVLPVLKRLLGEKTFELHIFGGREPSPLIAEFFKDQHVRKRGFVPDLDNEILSAPVFIVANNHRYFKVGHTRFLHAWSLGACVVAFQDSADAMPELIHRENALLASNADEFGQLVAEALRDRALREHLGTNGQRTLRERFDPRVVCRELEPLMRDALAKP